MQIVGQQLKIIFFYLYTQLYKMKTDKRVVVGDVAPTTARDFV